MDNSLNGTTTTSAKTGPDDDITERYSYHVDYIHDVVELMESIANKTVLPHQVEIQPSRIAGNALCWMSCPYCYGGSSENTDEHLDPDRYLDLMDQIANGPNGGIGKVVFAGYATDPLNYEHIDDLVERSLHNKQINGFNTKALKISDRLVNLLADPGTVYKSYFNISVDAGSPDSYNAVHGIKSSKDIYHKVLDNIRRIADARNATGATRDISASYLITHQNNSPAEIERAVRDIHDAGADLVRFTFPQLPRGMNDVNGTAIPTKQQANDYYSELAPLIEGMDSPSTRVLILNTDEKYKNIPRRVLPCLARFIFPTIGYDGFMYHCSQSAAPHFRELSLGNLQETDFWNAYYEYDNDDIWSYMQQTAYETMIRLDCRCDRKEQCVNALFDDHLPGLNGK